MNQWETALLAFNNDDADLFNSLLKNNAELKHSHSEDVRNSKIIKSVSIIKIYFLCFFVRMAILYFITQAKKMLLLVLPCYYHKNVILKRKETQEKPLCTLLVNTVHQMYS